jgi:hypothetical protein
MLSLFWTSQVRGKTVLTVTFYKVFLLGQHFSPRFAYCEDVYLFIFEVFPLGM